MVHTHEVNNLISLLFICTGMWTDSTCLQINLSIFFPKVNWLVLTRDPYLSELYVSTTMNPYPCKSLVQKYSSKASPIKIWVSLRASYNYDNNNNRVPQRPAMCHEIQYQNSDGANCNHWNWVNHQNIASCISQFQLRPAALKHQPTPPPPPPRWFPGISNFFWLGSKFPGVGTLELSNHPGWGRKKRARTYRVRVTRSGIALGLARDLNFF